MPSCTSASLRLLQKPCWIRTITSMRAVAANAQQEPQ
jgi:hypothetical protein